MASILNVNESFKNTLPSRNGTVYFSKISFHWRTFLELQKWLKEEVYVFHPQDFSPVPIQISDYILLSRTKTRIRVIICLCQGHSMAFWREPIEISIIKSSVTYWWRPCIKIFNLPPPSVYFPKTGYGVSELKILTELLLQYNVICKHAVNPVYI